MKIDKNKTYKFKEAKEYLKIKHIDTFRRLVQYYEAVGKIEVLRFEKSHRIEGGELLKLSKFGKPKSYSYRFKDLQPKQVLGYAREFAKEKNLEMIVQGKTVIFKKK
ncbi:MAG: hypothetical protein GY858_05535 [Candidatus Omnitrophica bacterium]|nr:hypothetical protein [Candidatus Omnitrophota bacterium]